MIVPDADVLGLSMATFVAGSVAAYGLFWLELAAFEVFWRAGLTFVVTYAAVFLLVKYLVWTILTEIAAKRRREFEQRQSEDAARKSGETE